MKLVYNIEIKAAPEKVFYWIERPEQAKQWVMNVSRTEYIKETPDILESGKFLYEWISS